MRNFLMLCLVLSFSPLFAQWEKLQAPGLAENIDLAKSNGHLFALTQFSPLQRSASNGLSWESTSNAVQLSGGVYINYLSVDADDDLLAVLLVGENGLTKVYQSIDFGDHWVALPGAPTFSFVLGEIYVHLGEVYLKQDGELYHFSNGSWDLIPSFSTNATKTFTFKGNQIWMSTNQKMQYSSNLGATWVDVNTPFNWAHSIASDGNGIVAAAEDFIYYTADDGANWQQRTLASHTNMKVISHDGIAYASESGNLYRSTNGFLTYTSILSGLGTVRDIHEINGYWVASTSYGVYRSASDPANWQWVPSGVVSPTINLLDATDGVLFYTNNQTAYSTDEGDTWQVTNDHHKFHDFLYNSSTSTWHGLKFHEIWKSTDLKNWTMQAMPLVDTSYMFWEYSGSNMVYCSLNPGSSILYSNNDGDTWLPGGAIPANGMIVLADNNFIYAHVDSKLLKSADFGLNWTEVGNNALAADPNVYIFRQGSPGVFYALNFTKMLVSYDAGVNWTVHSLSNVNPGLFAVEGCQVFNGNLVLEVQYDFDPTTHTMYMTQDDGVTFSPIMAGYTEITRGNFAWTGNNLFDLGDYAFPWRRGNFSVSVSQYSGFVYRDLDMDGQFDIGEPALPNTLLHLSNINQNTSAGPGGTFNIFAETQNDLLVARSPGKYCTFNPPNYTVNATDTNLDFALNCPAGITDLAVILYSGPFRPGFDTDINLLARNVGNDAADGTISLTLDSDVDFVSATPAAVQVGNVLTWPITSLQSLDQTTFVVRVHTPDITVLGTLICLDATITPNTTDQNTLDNTASRCRIAVGSYDPNDKEVDKTAYPPGTEPPLVYTVRFQNTGTYLASIVVIKDTLSPNLDPTTLQVLGASHPLTWTLRGNGIVEFRFDGINLPDMTSDEPGSHGFVQFSVEPKPNQPLGLMTENTAFIYFDFNQPIITNTVTSTVVSGTREPMNTIRLVAQPNPAHEFVQILFPTSQVPTNLLMYLHDASGRLIRTLRFDQQDMMIDVRSLKSGTYHVWGDDGNRRFSASFEVVH